MDKEKRKFVNKFNNLNSKEYLPFQKSWFEYSGIDKLYRENIRFFTKPIEGYTPNVYFYGTETKEKEIERITNEAKCKLISNNQLNSIDRIDFAIFDLLEIINNSVTYQEYKEIKSNVISKIDQLSELLIYRKFICIFVNNVDYNNVYTPYAWDLAKSISNKLSLKDEKIGCINTKHQNMINSSHIFSKTKSIFYSMYFRKDDTNNDFNIKFDMRNKIRKYSFDNKQCRIENWMIIKPKPRNKSEILHPAKYPEELIEKFIDSFTKENDNVFDPMTGTASTQVAALSKKRNAYGVELSEFFYKIAKERCEQVINPIQIDLFSDEVENKYIILCKDAREIKISDFPEIDYIITSPPYWDMLNMKGAINQALRKTKGLKTNYSDDDRDLGNIDDYKLFVNDLAIIYEKCIEILKPGGYITIIVKNIKKKGRNYPFAWDLAELLSDKLIMMPEVFWNQDDISIAPYGYGNTWVSNTFHQYCLNFQKPY